MAKVWKEVAVQGVCNDPLVLEIRKGTFGRIAVAWEFTDFSASKDASTTWLIGRDIRMLTWKSARETEQSPNETFRMSR